MWTGAIIGAEEGVCCGWTWLSWGWGSGPTLAVKTAGAAVERVVNEDITVHTEDTVARWAAEHLRTQHRYA